MRKKLIHKIKYFSMIKKSILCVLITVLLILAGIPMTHQSATFADTPIQQQLVTGDSVGLKGTDIYNGLRGQSFDEGWKFNKGDASNGESTSYNDSSWSNVTLPHDWGIFNTFNQYSPAGGNGGYLDGGIGWYRKTFTVPSNYSGKKVFIEFDGAYMDSQVWINGNLLGRRPYGYSSFEYDLTPYLNIGSNNVIAVKLNNNQPNSRWYSGSGIYRNVWLTVEDPVHVGYCGMFVTSPTVNNSSATANVSTQVLNQGSLAKSVFLTTTILDKSGNKVGSNTSSAAEIGANGNNKFSQDITVSNPNLWSPSNPYLYTVQTQVIVDGAVVDTYKSTMGFRYFNFDANNGFSLNGVSMKLNGVCLHHDLGALGAAVNYRAIERELQTMKDMGCNAIRTSHNPPDPELLEICDRMGFVVMDEAFDCWETGKTSNDYHLYFNDWAQTDLQAMVTRDRNHPSIVIWSIGNEIPNATASTASKLKNWVKAIDTTRPVTSATFATNMQGNADVENVLDLVGYNYFPWTYSSGHTSNPNWKIFGSETSSALRSRGVYKTPTDKNILTSDDNQCSSYDNSTPSWGTSAETSYSIINSNKYLAGEFIWTGFDYIGEPTPYGWPSKNSYFGAVDTCGFPKDIYYFYQSKWTTKPMVHILPHWNWSSGTNVDVWAYSNCDTVELFLNGTSLGVKTVGNSNHLSWSVPWTAGTLRAKATKGGTVVYDEVTTAGAPSKVLLKPDRTSITADGKDLVYIETDIADANNVIAPTADNLVNFSISGPGTIVGVDNGNSPSLEPYKASSRKAFNGKCLVIVQTTKTSGTIVVTANSNGLSSSSVSINTTPPLGSQQSAFNQIEAENFDNQSGIQAESCSEGGQDVGFIENGDYAVYKNIDFGSGALSFNARVASNASGGNIEIRLDSITGPIVGTCPVTETGDWQTWADAKCSVNGANGKHDVYLKFTGGSGYLFNLNWFQFTKSAFTQIEAESYSSQSGIQTENCSEGGQDIGFIENGDYSVYKNIDFGSGSSSFQARVASAVSGNNIEIRLDSIDGKLVGTCPVTSTSGWQTWGDATCSVSGVSGVHDLYLKFTGGSGYLLNVNWFKFTSEVTPTPTSTPTSTPTPTLKISPTSVTFNKSAPVDITVAITDSNKADNPIVSVYNGATRVVAVTQEQLTSTAAGYSGKFLQSYLNTLPAGTNTITFNFKNGQTLKLTINIVTSNIAITPISVTFNKAAPSDVVVAITDLNKADNPIVSVYNGATRVVAVTQEQLTSIAGGYSGKFLQSYLNTLPVGANTITFNFKNGQTLKLTINVITSNITIAPTSATFNKAAPADIIAVITAPNKAADPIVSVYNGTTQVVPGNQEQITSTTTGYSSKILKSYLSTLPVGDNTITFKFKSGSAVDFIVNVK